MGSYILMFGLLLNGEIRPLHDISGVRFDTLGECQETARNPQIRGSYQAVFPEDDLRIWCEPVRLPERSVQAGTRPVVRAATRAE